MPQVQLPIFPAGSVEINVELACRVEGEQVVYFNGHLPVFTHAKNDLASFRLFTSQLIVQGSATQGDVAKAFGVPLVAIKRGTKLYRERGPAGFFVSAARREGSRLDAEKLEQARALLVQGYPLPVVSAQTGVLSDTLRKAISAGRLPAVKKTETGSLVRPQQARTIASVGNGPRSSEISQNSSFWRVSVAETEGESASSEGAEQWI